MGVQYVCVEYVLVLSEKNYFPRNILRPLQSVLATLIKLRISWVLCQLHHFS